MYLFFKYTVLEDVKSSSPSGSDLMLYIKVKFSQDLSESFRYHQMQIGISDSH